MLVVGLQLLNKSRSNQTPSNLPDFSNSFIQAQIALDQQDVIDAQMSMLSVAGPKAEAYDRIAKAEGSLNLTEAAKTLQMRPKDLIGFLSCNGWIYRRNGSASWLGYQTHTTNGDLEHKVSTILRRDGSEKVTEQVRVTPQGLTKLAKLMPERLQSVA